MTPKVNPKRLTDVNKAGKELKGSILVDYENGADGRAPDSIHTRIRETNFSNAQDFERDPGHAVQDDIWPGCCVVEGKIPMDKQELDHK